MLGAYLLVVGGLALAWAALGLCCVGIGLLLRRLFTAERPGAQALAVSFWAGWAGLVALLQVWHLFLPVGGPALGAAAALGAAGLALHARALAQLATLGLRQASGPVILLALLLLWMANRSTGPAQFYDLGLYYLQSVAWNNAYPIVPGLGNLHGRLAFNSAYFLYAALVNVGPLAGRAVNVANGLLFAGLLAQGLLGAAALAAGRPVGRRFAFWSLLAAVPALYFSFGTDGGGAIPATLHLHGLAPDDGLLALGLALAGLCVALIFEPDALPPAERAFLRLAVALVAAVGVAVKLSFVAFAAASVLVVYGDAVVRERPHGRRPWAALLMPLALCVLLVGGVWAVRGVLLSGYPVYPSMLGALPVPWRVPTALVMSEANWVRSWARQQDVHWTLVLGSADWVQPWLSGMLPLLTRPFGLATLAGIVGLATLAGAPAGWRGATRGALLLLPALCSLLFWLATAPGHRFAGAAPWVLALGLSLLLTERLSARFLGQPMHPAACLAVALLVLVYVAPVRLPLLLAPAPGSSDGVWPLPQAVYSTLTTASGAQVHVPAGDNRCWAAPPPCTPYSRPELRELEPGRPGSGFALDPTREYVDIHGSALPPDVVAPVDLGVGLAGDWYDYDPGVGGRWVGQRGVVFLFTERPRRLRMELLPSALLAPSGISDRGRLLITVDGAPAVAVDAAARSPAVLALSLRPGFTTLVIAREGGALVPAAIIPGNADTRPLSVAVARIAFEDE